MLVKQSYIYPDISVFHIYYISGHFAARRRGLQEESFGRINEDNFVRVFPTRTLSPFFGTAVRNDERGNTTKQLRIPAFTIDSSTYESNFSDVSKTAKTKSSIAASTISIAITQ